MYRRYTFIGIKNKNKNKNKKKRFSNDRDSVLKPRISACTPTATYTAMPSRRLNHLNNQCIDQKPSSAPQEIAQVETGIELLTLPIDILFEVCPRCFPVITL